MDRVVVAPDPARAPCLHRAPAAVRRVRAQRFLSLFDCPAQAPPHPGHGCCRGPTLLPGRRPPPTAQPDRHQTATRPRPPARLLRPREPLVYHVQAAPPEPMLVTADYLAV